MSTTNSQQSRNNSQNPTRQAANQKNQRSNNPARQQPNQPKRQAGSQASSATRSGALGSRA